MKERGILFSARMVRAILAGKKTQTRRVIPASIVEFCADAPGPGALLSFGVRKYGFPGDRLWIRETWRAVERKSDSVDGILFTADDTFIPIEPTKDAAEKWVEAYDNGRHGGNWRPSIFMPRWASRITLEVTGVRVERLQEISGDDAVAEGIDPNPHRCGCESCSRTMEMCPAMATGCIEEYATLWESINGKRAGWDSNPWVWCVTFRRINAAHLPTPAARGAE